MVRLQKAYSEHSSNSLNIVCGDFRGKSNSIMEENHSHLERSARLLPRSYLVLSQVSILFSQYSSSQSQLTKPSFQALILGFSSPRSYMSQPSLLPAPLFIVQKEKGNIFFAQGLEVETIVPIASVKANFYNKFISFFRLVSRV